MSKVKLLYVYDPISFIVTIFTAYNVELVVRTLAVLQDGGFVIADRLNCAGPVSAASKLVIRHNFLVSIAAIFMHFLYRNAPGSYQFSASESPTIPSAPATVHPK